MDKLDEDALALMYADDDTSPSKPPPVNAIMNMPQMSSYIRQLQKQVADLQKEVGNLKRQLRMSKTHRAHAASSQRNLANAIEDVRHDMENKIDRRDF